MSAPLQPGPTHQQRLDQAGNLFGATAPPPKPPPKPRVQSVDEKSLDKAKKDAARTGLPQPVHAADGHVVYYVDYDGSVVPDAIAQDRLRAAGKLPAGGKFQTSDQGKLDRGTGALNQAQAAADAAAPNPDAGKLAAANALHGFVWVNGHRATIIGFDPTTKAPIVSYEGGTKQTPNAKNNYQATTLPGDTSAFGALPNGSSLNGASIFNMTAGPTDIFSGPNEDAGVNQLPNYTPAGVGQTGAAAEYSQSANAVTGRNQMTVSQGVQWFLNLSVQHPDVYKHLVDQLVAAHYITPGLGESAGGGYSADAAQGFAKATMDLAQINTTDGGKNLGLLDFLNQKQKAAQDAASRAAQPVTRNFQDPATLAYAARSAAQSAIGRNLTPAEEAAFEQAFRGKENAYYSNVDAANQAQAAAGTMNQAGPANSVPAPDTTGQAEQYLQGDQFGTQRAGYSMLEYLKAFQNFLGAGHL